MAKTLRALGNRSRGSAALFAAALLAALGASPAGADDDRIAERIRLELRENDATRGVRVEVADGTATLSGQVADSEAKHEAERLVERVPGVDEVDNEIRVMIPAEGPEVPVGPPTAPVGRR